MSPPSLGCHPTVTVSTSSHPHTAVNAGVPGLELGIGDAVFRLNCIALVAGCDEVSLGCHPTVTVSTSSHPATNAMQLRRNTASPMPNSSPGTPALTAVCLQLQYSFVFCIYTSALVAGCDEVETVTVGWHPRDGGLIRGGGRGCRGPQFKSWNPSIDSSMFTASIFLRILYLYIY
jgi:hypothetical protein